ncbi:MULTISPECIES: ABC transporter permease [unclassified Agromyces]|uniref:ABC transporter permease n=1 Tax=unclassified Agromyces TaxID=2639701 RepID=UPI00301569DF
MNRLAVLLAHRVRRDRVQLALWIVGTAALALMATTAVADTFGDRAERESILRLTILAPAILVFRGTPNGAGEGEFATFLILAFLALLAGLMSTFLAVRHTRGDEEQGRAELVEATPAGRTLPTAATVVHGVLANAVLGVAVALAFGLSGLPAEGSAVAGAAVAATGVAFFGVGLVAAQVFRTSRGANGFSVAVVLAAYLLRGLGDAMGESSEDGLTRTAAWPSRLSPIGWAQRAEPFAANDLAPLLLSAGVAAALVALVFAFQSARDSGASILPDAQGRAAAGPLLGSSLGLAWRLNAGAVLAWAVGAAVFGVLATTLSPLVDEIGSDAPAIVETLRRIAGETASFEEAFVTTFFTMVGILAAAAGLQAVMRARLEEAHGTAEPVLATPVSREGWLAGYAVVAAIAVVAVVGLAGAGAVLGAASADDPGATAELALRAALAQLPAALVYLGAVLVLLVVAPRLTIPVGWALLALGAFFGVFGELLGIPDWMHELSPFSHVPVPVGGEVDWTGGSWMLAIAAGLVAASVVGMRRRELVTEG